MNRLNIGLELFLKFKERFMKIQHLNEVKLVKGARLCVKSHKRNHDIVFIGVLISNRRIKKSGIWNLELDVESQDIEYFDGLNPNVFKYASIVYI